MAENSNIEWTHHTFNPWIGCTKVSPGCANCYAETRSKRFPDQGQWGPNGKRVVTSDSNWKLPLRWNRAAEAAGERHRVFCASLADVFEADDTMPEASRGPVMYARAGLFHLIMDTPRLDWLLLTKRPEGIRRKHGCRNARSSDPRPHQQAPRRRWRQLRGGAQPLIPPLVYASTQNR